MNMLLRRNVSGLGAWSLLMLGCGGILSCGCAAAPWDRAGGSTAAVSTADAMSHQVARSGGAGAVKPGQLAGFRTSAVANGAADVGSAPSGSTSPGGRGRTLDAALVRRATSRPGEAASRPGEAAMAGKSSGSPGHRQLDVAAAGGPRDPQRAEGRYQAALDCWQEGDLEGTKFHLDQALAADGRHRDANLLLAEWCLLNDRPEQATSRVAQLCRESPDDARAFHTLGMLLTAAGRDRDALALYERAARLAPDDAIYQ